MFNFIKNYLQLSSRQKRKILRETTRPIKDNLHIQKIYFQIKLSSFQDSFFQIKNLRFLGIFIILFWLFRDFAMAAEVKESTGTNAVNGAIELLNGVLDIITLIVHPIVMLIGWLLSPDWTMGDIIGLRPVIHKVWTITSNIVYIIFAFILIAMAFMNIFGESKNFAIKATLPKLIGGILMVPFTWFIVSAGLSISNVLTASVVGLAKDSIRTVQPDLLNKIKIPQNIYVDITSNDDWEGGETEKKKSQELNKTADCKESPSECVSLGEVMEDQNGAFNLLGFYAYGIFKIDKLKEMSTQESGKSVKKVLDIFKKLTFGSLFALIFAILVIALFFALLSRSVMLWLYAMFSPLFALTFFLKGKASKVEEKIKTMTITQFISLAMVPVYVSAALSFGLVFLSFAMNSDFKDSPNIKINNVDGDGDQTISFGSKEKKINLVIIGTYNSNSSGVFGGGLLDTAKGLVSQVIIGFIALGILWMAVMAALKSNSITENAVKPFDDMGKSVGGLLKDMPKYTPLPLPGSMKGQSIESMSQGLKSAINTATMGEANIKSQEFAKILSGKSDGLKLNAISEEVASVLKQNNNEATALQYFEKYKEAMLQGKDTQELSKNSFFREATKNMATSLGLSNEIKNKDLSTQSGLASVLGLIDQKVKSNGKDLIPLDKGGDAKFSEVDEYLKEHGGKGHKDGDKTDDSKTPEKLNTPKSVDYSGQKVEKTNNLPLEIKFKVDGVNKDIKLENSTIISKSNIAIDTNDRAELKGLLIGDKVKDENLFKKIFGDEVGKKVYEEIIK